MERGVPEQEFASTPVRLVFSASPTDEERCELDLEAQKVHERKALARLRGE